LPSSQILYPLENTHSRGQTPAPLSKDPHWYSEQQDENMQTSNNTKYLEWALIRDPATNEVVHSERVDIAQVESRKSFGRFGTVAFGDVAVDPNIIIRTTAGRKELR
jgi:hypothetical protein